ncbi:uncharacterized protein BP01DRAFT_392144 [Aspergillus saccharolyticus JOP 1030-1]|uniref:Uncharacterized protein n=1 Tax=Aspergillus saccharolyticus JOP 1030-1 TaxID=1450539 RepID=A0A318ZMS6_9EURO|nr:hypothetical protein BP01DRAFT_392144 [Aspergillus saccharolyticus JOP 1030-1]PYH45200.1 hypothetical protein BP01DRAFT_392144 [Aspergillus saccharolyticus JOP 1030-1]
MRYYRSNILSYTTPQPRTLLSQFEWLTKELHQAELHGQRVWLLAHVPPGNSHILPCYDRALHRMIIRFRFTITAQPTLPDKTSGSLPASRPSCAGPAFRIYDVDPATWEVVHSTVYVMDHLRGVTVAPFSRNSHRW